MRFDDSPDMFGCGVGASTGSEVVCEFCNTTHNKGYDVDRDGVEGNSVCFTNFAGKQICDCCFEKIEREILHRMDSILIWYAKIIKGKRINILQKKKLLSNCIKIITKEIKP